MNRDFVFVDEFLPGVRWDAKYATWDNFTGRPVDGYDANRIVATTVLCAALDRAQAGAASLGVGLLLWDGYRPQRAVERFLAWAEEPEDERTRLLHYPNLNKAEVVEQGYVAARSAHSRGSAVDLTVYDLATGELVPMGGDFDLMDTVSHHGAAGVTEEEAINRRRLRSLMETCGFRAYEREWWHYELDDEPYPDSYFDFPITSSCARRPRRRYRLVDHRRGTRARALHRV
jgi:zinc D-Ala-D-Ala dipeptidase